MSLATGAMLDGIKEACEAWGRAMRWILTADGEGYPTLATFERARGGELDAKAVGKLQQRFGEVMMGDALAVALAIRRDPGMPEQLHRVLFMHFVVPRKDSQRRAITVLQKARELGYDSAKPYYVALDNMSHFLLGRITIEVPCSTWNNVTPHRGNGVGTKESVHTVEVA